MQSPIKTKNFMILSLLILLVSIVLSLFIGNYNWSVSQLFYDTKLRTIILEIRLPRILVSILVGSSLSISGVIYQGIFRNPLVEPFILGVAGGASLGAAISLLFFPHPLFTQFIAFLGGLFATFITYRLGMRDGVCDPTKVIIAGVVTGSFSSALLSIIKFFSQDTKLRSIIYWLMGGIYFTSWSEALYLLLSTIAIITILYKLVWKLNILSLGDEEACALGLNVELYRRLFLTLATLLTAITVSISGVVAWVGLIIPHFGRTIVGVEHKRLFIVAGSLGAIFLLWCDTLARSITITEIPLGIITSTIGAPYLYLLIKKEKVYF